MPELPKVNGDYYQLQQVFLNIVTNAKTTLNQRGVTNEAAMNQIYIVGSHHSPRGSARQPQVLLPQN